MPDRRGAWHFRSPPTFRESVRMPPTPRSPDDRLDDLRPQTGDPIDDFYMIDEGPKPAPRTLPPRDAVSEGFDWRELVQKKWFVPTCIGAVAGLLALVVLIATSKPKPKTPQQLMDEEMKAWIDGVVKQQADYEKTPPSDRMRDAEAAMRAFQEAQPKAAPKLPPLAPPVEPEVVPPTAAEQFAQAHLPAYRDISPAPMLHYFGRHLEWVEFGKRDLYDVAVGGQGRYLFAVARGVCAIEVIDLMSARKVRTIPYVGGPFDHVNVVAGADVVVLVNYATGVATSWPMENFGPPTSVDLGLSQFRSVLLGSSSNGPLVVTHKSDADTVALYDPVTLRRVRYDFETPADREAFSKGFCHQVNSSGTLIRGGIADSDPAASRAFWKAEGGTLVRVGKAFADVPFEKPALCGDGDTVSTDRDTRKLRAGQKLDPLGAERTSARVYSAERTGQLLATHPSAGNPLEAALWKPGRKEPLAVLKNDAPAMALLRRTPFGTVRECRALFCVASMNLVVTQEQQRVTIWHADPASQDAEAVARAEVKVPPPAVKPPAAKAPVGPVGTVPQMVSRANRSVLVPPGLPMTYKVRVSAVQDFPVKFEITKGPEGLKIDDEGNVTWASPVGGEGTEYDVVVRVFNEEKKLELLDPWKLRITTAPPKRP